MHKERIQKSLYFIYCAIFFIAMTIPAVMTPFAPGVIGSDTAEKFDFSTQFGMRRQLVSLDAALKTALFRESPNEKVVYGREGWLFLAETLDWDTIPNNTLGKTATRIVRTLLIMKEYIEDNGARFIFMPAPNKARIYHENLPYYEPWPGQDKKVLYDLVLERAAAAGVNSIRLAERFSHLKLNDPDTPIYHKLDSHWNYLGAAEAYRMAMAEIESLLPDAKIAYEKYRENAVRVEADWLGDLDRMLNPMSERMDVQHYFDIPVEYRSRKPIVNLEDINIVSTSEKNDVRVLFFRDSFANALIQFFSNNLGEAAYTRSMPYPLSRVDNGSYDIVVAEIVERNLHWIVNSAPAIPAPLRVRHPSPGDLTGEAEVSPGTVNYTYLLQCLDDAQPLPENAVKAVFLEPSPDGPANQGAKLFGCIYPGFVPIHDEMRIFPLYENENGEIIFFEAFPIFEPDMYDIIMKNVIFNASVYNGGTGGGNLYPEITEHGFSFQINDDELSDGKHAVRALFVTYGGAGGNSFTWAGVSEQLMEYIKYEQSYE